MTSNVYERGVLTLSLIVAIVAAIAATWQSHEANSARLELKRSEVRGLIELTTSELLLRETNRECRSLVNLLVIHNGGAEPYISEWLRTPYMPRLSAQMAVANIEFQILPTMTFNNLTNLELKLRMQRAKDLEDFEKRQIQEHINLSARDKEVMDRKCKV